MKRYRDFSKNCEPFLGKRLLVNSQFNWQTRWHIVNHIQKRKFTLMVSYLWTISFKGKPAGNLEAGLPAEDTLALNLRCWLWLILRSLKSPGVVRQRVFLCLHQIQWLIYCSQVPFCWPRAQGTHFTLARSTSGEVTGLSSRAGRVRIPHGSFIKYWRSFRHGEFNSF